MKIKNFFIGVVIILAGILVIIGYNTKEIDIDNDIIVKRTRLMIRTTSLVSEQIAKEYGATCKLFEILGESGQSKIRPTFEVDATFDLDMSRKFAFELTKKYREAMTENKEIQEFYRIEEPEYDLQKNLFPLKKLGVRVAFYENDQLCEEPYIAQVIFDGAEFHYYVQKPNSDTLKRIFRESYADAEAYYTSQKAS